MVSLPILVRRLRWRSVSPSPPQGGDLLCEDGNEFLMETGETIILER